MMVLVTYNVCDFPTVESTISFGSFDLNLHRSSPTMSHPNLTPRIHNRTAGFPPEPPVPPDPPDPTKPSISRQDLLLFRLGLSLYRLLTTINNFVNHLSSGLDYYSLLCYRSTLFTGNKHGDNLNPSLFHRGNGIPQVKWSPSILSGRKQRKTTHPKLYQCLQSLWFVVSYDWFCHSLNSSASKYHSMDFSPPRMSYIAFPLYLLFVNDVYGNCLGLGSKTIRHAPMTLPLDAAYDVILEMVSSYYGCSPTILLLGVYSTFSSLIPDSYRNCFNGIRFLVRNLNLCSLVQTIDRILLSLDKYCYQMCRSSVPCMLHPLITARSMRPIPSLPVPCCLVCLIRHVIGGGEHYAENSFSVLLKGSTLFSVTDFKVAIVDAAAPTRTFRSLFVFLNFPDLMFLAKPVGIEILGRLCINGCLDSFMVPILCFYLLIVCGRMLRGGLIPSCCKKQI